MELKTKKEESIDNLSENENENEKEIKINYIDHLSENEKIITDCKFFGDNEPCIGKSYPVVFYKYNDDTSLYIGHILDFSREITLRSSELPKQKRKFNSQLININGNKIYYVKYDTDNFCTFKNVNKNTGLFKDIKTIKRKLINFFHENTSKYDINIIEFWDKYIVQLAYDYNEMFRETKIDDESKEYNISIIEFLKDKYSDNIYIEYLNFLNKVDNDNKLVRNFVEFKSLDLNYITSLVTNSLIDLKKMSVTYCKEQGINEGTDFSIKFKIEGNLSDVSKFKENILKENEKVIFTE